jgi:hypothetical protein
VESVLILPPSTTGKIGQHIKQQFWDIRQQLCRSTERRGNQLGPGWLCGGSSKLQRGARTTAEPSSFDDLRKKSTEFEKGKVTRV